MDKRDEVLRAVNEASKLVRRFDDEARTSFDLYAVIKHLDIPVIYRPLENLWGGAVSVGDQHGILLKSDLPLHLQRFTLAHEIGHIVLGHENQFDREVGFNQRSRNPGNRRIVEIATDTFASELLAPRSLIQRNANDQGWGTSDLQNPNIIYQLSLRLGLSFEATCWSLVEQSLLDRAIAEEYVDQADIVKEAKNYFAPADVTRSSWDHVWYLTEGDSENRLETDQEDIFVFQLEEKSSSGYRWEIGDEQSSVEVLHDENIIKEPIGSPTTRSLAFRFDSPGEHLLTLQEKRPWSGKVHDQLTFSIDNWGRERNGLPRRERKNNLEVAVA